MDLIVINSRAGSDLHKYGEKTWEVRDRTLTGVDG